MKLADFKDGLIPLMQWPDIESRPLDVAQINRWVETGKLFCPDYAKPTLLDQLFLVEERRATKPAAESKPAEAIKVKPGAVLWLTSPLVWRCGYELGAGSKVEVFDPKRPHKFDKSEIAAVEDCAARRAKETGEKPVIAVVKDWLTVIETKVLTDKKPVKC